MKSSLVALAFAAAALAGSAAALAGDYNFKTPSRNIYCGYYDFSGTPEVRCDIRNFRPTGPKRPADCDLEWGDAYAVGANDRRGVLVCHGDTIISPNAATLGYGKTFARGGISCVSQTSGLTCKNRKGHGFSLSKAKQRVF